ncbi:MAG: hypothetical protein WC705_03175 [Candidatus Paceibacterota bacterium]|jgi:hypothetical protein
MIKDWFSRISKRTKWVIATIILIFVVAFLMFVFSPLSKASIPPAFSQARQEGSIYAKEIAVATNEIAVNLNGIGELKDRNEKSKIFDLVIAQIQKNNQTKEKALLLTEQLRKMTSALPDVTPEKAGQVALEALTSETVLVQKLINYSDLLNQLLNSIKDKLASGDNNYDSVNKIIDNINKETSEINKLNEEFSQKMDKFDGYF